MDKTKPYYKRFEIHRKRAECWLGKIARRDPELFYHWQFVRPKAE